MVSWKAWNASTRKYPLLKRLIKCTVHVGDPRCCVRIDRAVLKTHIRTLADKMVLEQEEDNQTHEQTDAADGGSVHVQESLQQHTPGVGALRQLKSLLPTHRHNISILWDEANSSYTDNQGRISELLLAEAHRRQGHRRGHTERLGELLCHSRLDLSQCTGEISAYDVLQTLLAIKPGKAMGPNGIP